MDHAAALGDAAHAAGFAADLEFHGHFLGAGVGGHDGLGRIGGTGDAQTGHQGLHAVCNGGQVQDLADDTGGGHHHIGGGDAGVLFHQGAHILGDLDAVPVAGVGVAGVADDRLGDAVGDVVLGDGQGRALDEIGGVDRRGGGGDLADDQGQILFGVVSADAAVDAIGFEAGCGADAAGNQFHSQVLLYIWKSPQGRGVSPPFMVLESRNIAGMFYAASVYLCHCEEGEARRGNPFFSVPEGDGRCCASQGMRIATAFGLAMTAIISAGPYRLRPVVSSRPSMMFMFWMAAPLAPLPRLSKRAVTMVCFSWPVTRMRMVSLFARVEA